VGECQHFSGTYYRNYLSPSDEGSMFPRNVGSPYGVTTEKTNSENGKDVTHA